MLSDFLKSEGIDLFAPLPLEGCTLINRRLLARLEFVPRSALLFAIPYFVGLSQGNLSLYARSKDYHLYAKELEGRLLPLLSRQYQENHFALFSDHSPINERSAAVAAGLGYIGDNGLLITEKYGSFVFLGALFSDLEAENYPKSPLIKKDAPKECLHCGACKKACPCLLEDCASGVGQKKGTLTPQEEALVLKTGLVWGCDLCQIVCPLNKNAKKSAVPFFYEDRMESITPKALEELSEDAFNKRAFAWRGRAPILRNAALFEEHKKQK